MSQYRFRMIQATLDIDSRFTDSRSCARGLFFHPLPEAPHS